MYYPVHGITISVMMNKDINTGSIAIDFMNTVISNNPIGIEPISTITPGKFSLEQNYPNPFNPETNIMFSIPERSFVKIKIFDVTGKQVELLLNENINAGTYEVKWNASMKPSGIYFYRIEAGNFSKTRKMSVIK
jgi:hypothetical protein